MNIEVSNLGKSFNHQRIFHNLTYTFQNGQSYSILGPNGSGKSTLLKILSGFMHASRGTITYKDYDKVIDPDSWYKYQLIAAPYMELPEELTLREFLRFHYKFKKLSKGYKLEDVINKCGLHGKEEVQIINFSSGMKQRLKLAIGMYSNQEILLMDEPVTNLDEAGVDWYLREIKGILPEKLVIIASNTLIEHDFCQNSLNLNQLK
jgi:ABC-type multidrug transport system ATPase subunit